MKIMNRLGYIRHADSMGRIVIPKDIREQLNIIAGDAFEIHFDMDTKVMRLKKFER